MVLSRTVRLSIVLAFSVVFFFVELVVGKLLCISFNLILTQFLNRLCRWIPRPRR